jgi:hypothetical protein
MSLCLPYRLIQQKAAWRAGSSTATRWAHTQNLTSTPQRRVTNTFRLNARLPLLVNVAPSSLLEGVSSTDRPSCSRGLRQLSRQLSTLPTGHSAASTGLVMPPKTGKGRTFLQTARPTKKQLPRVFQPQPGTGLSTGAVLANTTWVLLMTCLDDF